MKFKPNDFIIVPRNGFLGYIHAVDQVTKEYLVEWENRPLDIIAYKTSECDNLWESATRNFNPKGVYSPYKESIKKKDPKSCPHHFVVYNGFREVYEFCVHCDTKKIK